MVRFFFIVILFAGAIWLALQYKARHPDFLESPFAQATPASSATKQSTPPAAAPATQPGGPSKASAPVPGYTLENIQASLRALEQNVLAPVYEGDTFSSSQAFSSISGLENQLANYKMTPNYRRTQQACSLLRQAVAERAGYVERVGRNTEKTDLDKIPGRWKQTNGALNANPTKDAKTYDPNQQSMQSRDQFFKEAAANQWLSRASIYRAQLAPLLAP